MEFESTNSTEQDNNEWQTVTYKKHNNRNKQHQLASNGPTNNNNSNSNNNNNVFTAIEKQSEERRKGIEAAKRLEVVDDPDPDPKKTGYDGSDDEEVVESSVGVVGEVVEKKKKKKKVKKVKVSVAEAGANVDADELAEFLLDVTTSFEEQQDIQMMRFVDFFGRAFSNVTASQFPWVKLFRESPVAKIADNPVSHISEAVYKTSVDWINKRSMEALHSFLVWSLDSVLTDLESQLGSLKGSKKGAQKTSSKSQVGLFVVLAMVLRKKPDASITILPNLNETLKQNAQDKLPVIVWMVTQASQGDLAVGLYLWSRLILPIVGTKSGSNPQTRDLILQLVERILSAPKAQTILVNGAVRKGERLVPPTALDLLLRTTFPSSSARIKATERFEAVYPTLKKVALAGTPGSKAMKQVYQQIINISLKPSAEGIPELSDEASNIFIWCLTQNPDSCKQWDTVYSDNLEASIIILKRLNEQWKELSQNQSFREAFTQTLKSLNRENEKAIREDKTGDQALYKEADKYCKVLLGRQSRRWGCAKATVLLVVAFGVGATFLAPNALESLDWNKLSEVINVQKFV
ncbi:uncharacterized protein LOC143588708 [Bidens hawaiensis]|uniref:uncharacterized protein LOC143588708 n=1 Tax=Bidens hawaiensis TaxID=980011 RepID=UPI004049405D